MEFHDSKHTIGFITSKALDLQNLVVNKGRKGSRVAMHTLPTNFGAYGHGDSDQGGELGLGHTWHMFVGPHHYVEF